MSQFQDSSKLDTKHLVTGESRSVPSSRRNSGHNPNAFQLQPNLQHNLSTNVLNVNGGQAGYSTGQISGSQFQLMNRRPSSSTAIVTTANQFHGSQTVLSQTGGLSTVMSTQPVIKTASSVSTLTINHTKSKSPGDHLSSSTNHLTTLVPMSGYVGSELVKTSSATLTTTNSAQAASKQFLDVNNNASAYSLRRKSSSALSNASQMQFNRTLSLRSNSTNEAEIVNTVSSSGLQAGVVAGGNSISASAINSAAIEPQMHSIQMQQPMPNQLAIQNQAADYALTRQASIQMRSGSIMMKSMTDVDKQSAINKQINFSSASISSALATPLRRPSNTSQQHPMQPRCISAMDNLRRRPLSISANSCSSSDELTDDTESLSKAGTKHEVDSCLRSGKIIGEIKLSIVMTKGLLEIDILEAKLQNLNNNPNKPGELFVLSLKMFEFKHFRIRELSRERIWSTSSNSLVTITCVLPNRHLCENLPEGGPKANEQKENEDRLEQL